MSAVQGLILIFHISLKISLSQILSYKYYDINSNADGVSFVDSCESDGGYGVGVDSSGIIHINKGIECVTSRYITYNPITNEFASSTGCSTSCPISNGPIPQFFAQLGDIMYITSGDSFFYYNLNTPSTPYVTVSNLNFPTRMKSNSMCMAITSDQQYLIGIGGLEFNTGNPSTNIQILDLLDKVWIDDESIYLPSTRFGCRAIVHPYNDNLYVSGGWRMGVDDYQNSLWSLYTGNMTNIIDESWNEYSRDVLATDQFARLIAKEEYLIILGGYSTNKAGIIILDVSGTTPSFLTETVEINDMLWGNAGFVTVANRIYVFGVGETNPMSQWQWIDLKLPTNKPTNEPTVEPTINPSIHLTNEPTIEPTIDPINDPTLEPTTEPTSDPTAPPIESPSRTPTKPPTFNPTMSNKSSSSLLERNNNISDDLWWVCLLIIIFIVILLALFVIYCKRMKNINDTNWIKPNLDRQIYGGTDTENEDELPTWQEINKWAKETKDITVFLSDVDGMDQTDTENEDESQTLQEITKWAKETTDNGLHGELDKDILVFMSNNCQNTATFVYSQPKTEINTDDDDIGLL